ncbi:MAG TPA: F0F1 ATP synthase subunit A [Tepidisphaeraceae bacterium]|jgi:F0F1-type ATP synthase membrane subunit a
MTPISLLASTDPLEHVLPHYLFEIAGIKVTNQMFMGLVAAVLMLLIFPLLFRRLNSDPPTGPRNFFEAILEFLRVEVFRPALKEHTDRFVPFLWTVFFFILFCNLLGQIPFAEFFTLLRGGARESHLGGTATGNVAITGALALCTFLVIHVSGILQVARALISGTYGHHEHHEEHSAHGRQHGHESAHDLDHARGEALPADIPQHFTALGSPTKHYHDDEHTAHRGHEPAAQPGGARGHGGVSGHEKGMNPVLAILAAGPLYIWNFAPHPFKPNWWIDVPMWMGLLVLEFIGAIIKPFALMIRLFANMIAGHIVLAVLVGLVPVGLGVGMQLVTGIPVTVLSLLIRFLELFVAFLQAYIFTFLATLFIASAVAPEH